MNNRVSKKLARAVNASSSPVTRRVYRRLKKAYGKIPWNQKHDFLENELQEIKSLMGG
jgi:hypothetical protein